MASLPSRTLKLVARLDTSPQTCALIRRLYHSYTKGLGTQVSLYGGREENSGKDPASVDVRNVSRLPENAYKLYHGQAPDLPYKDLHRRRKLCAQLGAASGEDPRILWPSRAKLLDMEQEEIEEGSPLEERLARIQAEKMEAESAKLQRRALVAKTMQQMPKLIADYKKKLAAVDSVAKDRAAKKEVLLQEARDLYGYKVQANDPKFQEMTEQKELLEKAEKKKLKKEERKKKADMFYQELEQTPSK